MDFYSSNVQYQAQESTITHNTPDENIPDVVTSVPNLEDNNGSKLAFVVGGKEDNLGPDSFDEVVENLPKYFKDEQGRYKVIDVPQYNRQTQEWEVRVQPKRKKPKTKKTKKAKKTKKKNKNEE